MRDCFRSGTGLWKLLLSAVALVALVALMAGTLAAPAAAQTVQKCIAADGHVTLTSAECGAGERLAASYAAVPEHVAPGSAAGADAGRKTPARAAQPGTAARVAPGRSARTAPAHRRSGPDRCRAARDRRERALARVGLKRTFDLLRKLDDEVWAACR